MGPKDSDDMHRRDQAGAWDALAVLASGVAVWGGVGWLISEWLHSSVFLMMGLLVGMGSALYLIWHRYGKP
jgi:F0F1-type ATP synthase assembly protein I